LRLGWYLALAGVASRRKAEQIIASGRVAVNGTVVTLPQYRVEAGDRVTVDGRAVEPAGEKYYLLLDKPAGYLSTVSDPRGRRTVLDLIGRLPARLYPVGRLDLDTTGVLLLTNDGELAYRLTHPRFEVKKRYRARVKGVPDAATLARMARGMELEEGHTAPAEVRLIRRLPGGALLEIVLIEGRKRQDGAAANGICLSHGRGAEGRPVPPAHRERGEASLPPRGAAAAAQAPGPGRAAAAGLRSVEKNACSFPDNRICLYRKYIFTGALIKGYKGSRCKSCADPPL